jgi:carboxyl-terminal processing protease
MMIKQLKFLLIALAIPLATAHPATTQAAEVPPALQSAYDKFADVSDESAHEAGQALIEKILKLIEANYALEVDVSELAPDAIKKIEAAKFMPSKEPPRKVARLAVTTMVKSLDPHSSYLTPEAYKELKNRTKGTFGGLGMEVTLDKESGLVKVIAPIDSTPAARAGIMAGDLISHLDGNPLKGLTLRKAVKRMRGKPGSRLVLTVIRNSDAPFDVAIVRAIIRYVPVKAKLIGKTGYIRITRFNRRTNKAVRLAIGKIRAKLGDDLRGIVLDLRNNPGGLLNQSVSVAGAFLDSGIVVSSKGRKDGSNREMEADDGDLTAAARIIVLINSGSASASEIVAGALQDHARATVMGTRSFGKGSVQTIFKIGDEGALKITTAMYYLPEGRLIQKHGLTPDIRITPEKKSKRRREIDLKRALKSDGDTDAKAKLEVKESQCPVAGKERKDRILGCALLFLKSKDTAGFMRRVARPVLTKP